MPEFLYPAGEVLLRLKALLLGPLYPLHRSEPYRPFFIVGSGRSGTTLLRRILQASPQIHIPPEMHALGHAIMVYRRNRNTSWLDLVSQILALLQFNPNFHIFGVSLRPLFARLAEVPNERRSLALLLDSFYRYHGEQTGQESEIWGDKTPLNSFWLDAIHAVFPHARFIHMLRDGVDVVMSVLTSSKTSPDVANLEAAALQWKTSVAAVRRFSRRQPRSCFEVRYEKLVTEPTAVMKSLCRFLGIRHEASMTHSLDHVNAMGDVPRREHHINVMKPITPNRIGTGRRNLSRENKQRLQTIIGRELALSGHDPVV